MNHEKKSEMSGERRREKEKREREIEGGERERENSKWHVPLNFQNLLPPVTYFLPIGHTS